MQTTIKILEVHGRCPIDYGIGDNMKYTISTEYNGEHKDFQHDEQDELESYLDSINPEYMDQYYSFDSLYSRVRKALKNRIDSIVEPASENDDISIDITYI